MTGSNSFSSENLRMDFDEIEEGEPEDELEEEIIEGPEGAQSSRTTQRLRAPNERKTKPILTKFEIARLLSHRTAQLENGQLSVIPEDRLKSIYSSDIAKQELYEKVIPLKVVRHLPDNTYEVWSINEFKYFAR